MVCAEAADAIDSARQNSNTLISVPSERQIEASFDREFWRRSARNDSRDAVVPQTGGAAEDEQITRLQEQRLNRIPSLETAKQKSRRIAKRDRDNRQAGVDGFPPFVFVLMQAHPAVGVVPVHDAEVRREGESCFGGRAGRQPRPRL